MVRLIQTSDGAYFVPDDDETPSAAPTPTGPIAVTDPWAGTKGALAGMFGGVGGNLPDPDQPDQRFQWWPEKMARSGLSLPFDVMSGAQPMIDPATGHTPDTAIARSLDTAGLFSGGAIGAPKARLPVEPTFQERLAVYNRNARQQAQGMPQAQPFGRTATMMEDASPGAAVAAVANAAPFYSAVENAVKNAKMNTGTADQWQGYLKNQPGVKQEELSYLNLDQLPTGQITKGELEKHIGDNAIKVGEVWKGKRETIPQELLTKLDAKANEMVGPGEGFYDLSVGQRKHALQELGLDERYLHQDPPSETKFDKYQLPGGENYKEMLLTLPNVPRDMVRPSEAASAKYLTEWNKLVDEHKRLQPLVDDYNRRLTGPAWEKAKKDYADINKKMDELHDKMVDDTITASGGRLGGSPFQSTHWSEPNVLAHVRMNDRNIPGVGKSLHMEEVQSDWHQQGRKEGYKSKSPEEAAKLETEFEKIDDKIYNSKDEAVMGNPDLKEAVGMAVQKNIITPAEGEAYLRHVSSTSLKAVPDAPFKSGWADLALKRVIRQAAENGYDAISWTPGEANRTNPKNLPHEGYSEEQLAKADAGQKQFYDKIMVDKANNLTKKFGGKVEQTNVNTQNPYNHELGNKIQPVHVLKITPELRKAALEKGFPLFESGIPNLVPVQHEPEFETKTQKSRATGNKSIPKLTPVPFVPDFT